MLLTSWLQSARTALRPERAGRRRRRARQVANQRLQVLTLEGRDLPSFTAPVAYSAGVSTQAVVTADFNNDSHLDIAVANYGDNNVSVLLGKGDGTFAAAKNSATGSSPRSIAVGDFNNDGLLDVATGNSYEVSVLLGKGDGSFAPPINTSLGSTLGSIAVGDFNNDGKLDVGASSSYYISGGWGYYGSYPGYYYNYANVLLGNGAGSLSLYSTAGVSTSYYSYNESVAVADFNNDGRDDLAVGMSDYWSAAVFLANTDGSLGYGVQYSVGGPPTALAAGDVSGDGKADLLAAQYGGVSVLLGDGAGGLGAYSAYSTGGSPVSLALGDFNANDGDGKIDIAAVNSYGNGLSVFLGKGGGAFTLSSSPTSDPNGSTGVAVGDFDGDGWLDAVRSSYADPDLQAFHNDHVWPALDAPSLSISDVSMNEGNIGTSTASFNVTLSAASSQTVTVAYRTVDSGATAGVDYQAKSGTLTFAPGETSKTIDITVVGDRTPEWSEQFQVVLSDSVNSFLNDPVGYGTILDDEPTVGIQSDVSRLEGNSGTTPFTFTITLSAAYDAPVTVNYSTADLTADEQWWYGPGATAGEDYVAASGSVTFAPGETSKTVDVLVNGDRIGEYDEYFWFKLDTPDYAHLGYNQALGDIQNDEPYISVGGNSIVEGNSGTKTMSFTVSLSNATDAPVTVDYATVDGSALAGSDYQAKTGTVTIPAGQTTATVDITINGDRIGEYDEYFAVNLSNPNGGMLGSSTGYGTIQDDEPRISINSPSPISEGNRGTKGLVFTITLSTKYDQSVTVKYSTSDGSAKAGEDYVATSGTVTFAPGETSKTITVLINGDKKKESDEWFAVNLSNASSDALIWYDTGYGTIKNDDGGRGK